MRLRAAALAAAAWVTGCGYVGDPLPPALNIPERVSGLRAVQIGDRLVIEYALPERTVEALPLKPPVTAEVRIEGSVYRVDGARAEVPASNWVGQTVEIAARALAGERASEWSQEIRLQVVPPLKTPAELRVESHAKGVRLSWAGEARPGIAWRVFRGRDEIAIAKAPEYVDAAAEYGKTWEYSVEAALGTAVSERAGPAKITPEDKFAPPVPSAVAAVPGVNTIELTWEPVLAPDLKSYRIYRFAELVGEVNVPAWSDKQIESGRPYAYAVTAIDARGNESARSTPVELTAP